MERALPSTERGSPDADRTSPTASTLLLLFAETPAEEDLLHAWMVDTGRAHAAHVRAGRGELERSLAAEPEGDPNIVPVRVAWLPRERGGDRKARLREVLALRDPRRPKPSAQARIARADPGRSRVIVGEPARVSELRRRFGTQNGEAFGTFVERQGVLTLERAERDVIGEQYKVPKLVHQDLSASPRFQAMVERLAREAERDVADVSREASAALDEMVASQSRLAIDAWDHFGRFLSRAYTIDVDTGPLEELRRLNRSRALVFLPSHRSYIDTLILRPVLHRHGFPPNHVLGGANLDFWPIGPVSRRNGYVFIRRSMKDARVYKAVLREYLGYLLRKRFNLEWYIEGGRTRTGKLRPPRYGILSYLVDAFEKSGIDEVAIVPVSIVYDQLHEVGAIAAEEHGATKQAEGIGWIVGYAKAQQRPLGHAHVRFAEPLSLREALRDDGSVPKVAFEVLHRINRVTPITPSAVVALALLGGDGGAVTYDEGSALIGPVLDYVEARGIPTVVRAGDAAVVKRALGTLVREGVVTEFTGGTEPVYAVAPGKHVEVAFYRNNAVHHFVTRAITELALVHAATGEFADRADEFWQEAVRLRDLLKFEFFFPRKRVFSDDLRAELAILDPGWEQRAAEPREIEDVLERAPVLFAPHVLGPFLEAYGLVADRLAARDPRREIDEDAFVRECLGVGRQYAMQQRLHDPESVSRELFRGALQLAANRDLVDPGRDEVRARRDAFAAEVAEILRRVDMIRAVARGRSWQV
ncbi:MAG: glycerol-3-phosphate 1-O-acyltransferase [Actinobacteria bacterium]|nr:MAG: glycerol-3-phosphate 1-O-acyltransferase [Actinomycetota bacterium]